MLEHFDFNVGISVFSALTMSEDRRRGEDADEAGPGLVYMPFVVMEDLLDKFRLLDYEKEFIRKMNMKPISRYFKIGFLSQLTGHRMQVAYLSYAVNKMN